MSQRLEIQLSLLSKSLNKNCRYTVWYWRLFKFVSKLLFFFHITSIAFKLSSFNLLQKMINFHLINSDFFYHQTLEPLWKHDFNVKYIWISKTKLFERFLFCLYCQSVFFLFSNRNPIFFLNYSSSSH